MTDDYGVALDRALGPIMDPKAPCLHVIVTAKLAHKYENEIPAGPRRFTPSEPGDSDALADELRRDGFVVLRMVK